MKVVEWEHCEVNKDGFVKGGGAVQTEPCTRQGKEYGEFFFMVSRGLENGKVKGCTAYFDTEKELDDFVAFLDFVGYKENKTGG